MIMENAGENDAAGVMDLVNPTRLQTIGGTRERAGRVFLTTLEASAYLRRSVSWLLRQPDIAYLPGKPNLYAQGDLDVWVERHKIRPKVRV